MNMHGIMEPASAREQAPPPALWLRIGRWFWLRRMFSLVVVLPTLLVAGYLFLIASDQYESEAHFLVRSSNSTPTPSIGISQALSSVTGISASQNEAMSVADYLTSHDVVANLRKNDGLVQRFHRPDADILSRLWSDNPTPEWLLSYYQRQVKIEFNTETGITTLRVHSFRPQDSYQLAEKLLELGEQRVNQLNTRSYNDAISLSVRQLHEAENSLAAIQDRMTRFRQTRADIDPTAVGQAQLSLVGQLAGQLATARAQLNSMGHLIKPSSPQYQAMARRVQALNAQVQTQSGRLTGSGNTIANDIGGYEDLKLRQQFLAKGYDAAASALQNAREQAEKQQLYVVRVVEPNVPVKALYPQRWRILITVFVALMLAYSIGWLIAAGVKEHAA